jgi:hypothetical protein
MQCARDEDKTSSGTLTNPLIHPAARVRVQQGINSSAQKLANGMFSNDSSQGEK